MHKWHVYNQFDEASKAAAVFLAITIQECIDKKGVCHVALSGGNSPARCLNYLAQEDLAWHKVHWYLADERCYPKDHPERNDRMLKQNLWSRITATNINVIPAELGAEQAAEIYREIINKIDYLDIAFLGVGEDGHTASLFPGNKALNDTRSVIPVYDSPKPPSDRVSLSISFLKKAACRVVLSGGIAKAPIMVQIKADKPLPVNCVGDIHWYVDEVALSKCSL